MKTTSELASVASEMDWQQVVLNGGPPCFHICRDGRFCGRAQHWAGHNDGTDWPDHKFVTLGELIQSALDAQAAQYREVIKAATDASSKLRRELSPEIHLWPEYQDFADAMDALVYISELTPKV